MAFQGSKKAIADSYCSTSIAGSNVTANCPLSSRLKLSVIGIRFWATPAVRFESARMDASDPGVVARQSHRR